jgi:hypothetical protein
MNRIEYEKQWRDAHPERVLQYYKTYYYKHKEEILARRKARWRAKHPPRVPRTSEQIQASLRNNARRFQDRRLAFYRSLKDGKECVDCGETDPACLDFHHRDPAAKEMNIGLRGRYMTRERLLREVAKCDVVCVNCHRKRHKRERRGERYLSPVQKERMDAFLEVRRNSRCSECGTSDPDCLDFHHLDPATKSFGVANKAPRVSHARLLKEIAKCVVVCANCHRKRHYKARLEKAA